MWFSKIIVCGTTIASAALVYCIIILHNRREKKETGKADNNKVFEIKITDTFSPNIHNGKQIFTKNSANPNNTPLVSKVRQVVSPLSKQSASYNPVKPLRSKRLFQIQSKVAEDHNSIMQNNTKFFTHDDSSETTILNNPASSFECGFGNAQDNLNRSLVIHINNLIDTTNNKVQIKVFNKSIKPSMLDMKTHVSNDPSTNNRSGSLVTINQKDEPKEIDIMIPPFSRRRVMEHVMTFRGNQLTNARNNKCTKEIEGNDVTIIINASM